MNLHLFLRSLAVAGAATAVIALATGARAEGGEVSVVPIEEVHQAVPAAPEPPAEAAEAPAEPEPARPLPRSRAAKAAKAPLEAAVPVGPAEGPAEPPAAAASAEPAAEVTVETVEVEAPLEETSPRRRSRKLDRTAQDAARAAALRALVEHHAAEAGVPFDLADAVIRIESRYSAGARNGPNVGLTQINTRTAQSLGYQGAAAGLLDPETNLRYGLEYLARAYALAGGDTCGTILRYQAGLRAQSMTRAARSYCGRVKTIIASAQ